MAKFFILLLLVRVLLPVSLLISIALRPFGLSCLYLLLFLLSPLVPIPGPKTIKGLPGQFLFLNVVVSTLLLVGHVIFHSTLAGFAPYGSLIKNYPLIEKICQNLGFYSFRNVSMSKGVWCVIPEVNSFISSITIYTLAKRIVVDSNISEQLLKVSKNQKYPMLTTVGKYVCLFLIMFAGIMRPSITSGIYYLVFMASATAWSLGRHLERGFATVCRCLSVLMVVHVAILFCYQCTWIMDIYPPERNFARYFGLTRLVIYNGNGTETFEYSFLEDQKWGTLASPLVILITYYFLVIETRELFKPKLISSLSPSKRRSFQNRKRNLRQDSAGSVIMPNDDDLIEDIEPTLMDEIIQAIIDFFKVMVRSSYIATTITMMAWSIMYHSWLTFVFLMWANVVWLWPNQRTFMLKTSPLLVFYAMLLLLAQYIYGMNLTKDELPSEVPQVNLNQIGLSHPMGEACLPLLVKSLFTCMFWVTLRQRWQDFQDKRRAAVVTDMAAPLQLTVSTAASVLDAHQEEEKQSRLLKILGEWLRAACAHYWIYVVVIMLFVIGITGDRMTIFRIIYMLLFLVFILMFQFSWYWWRRLIYVFWIVVIIYSMVNLILIYVYQFDNFSKMIEQYLLVNEKLQHDLGLDTYNPAHLFVKLLTPTLFLIITVMQVHYFHKDFLALSDPATRHNSMKDPESSRQSGAGASTMNNDVPQLPLDALDTVTEADHSIEMESMQTGNKPHNFQKKSVGTVEQPSEHRSHTFRDWLRDTIKTAVSFFNQWVDNMFLYLEIHLIKIIMVSLMLLCVSNVSAIHVPIMIIITPGLLLNRKHQRFCVLFISLLISIYLMATMVYQIGYIRHSYFDCNCTVPNENDSMNITTFNNAVWFGFKKASSERPLVTLTKGYIGLMAVITFYSLVTYRQRNIRKYGLLPDINDNVIFPEVKRVDADKDVPSCLKFFVNYGFYKFGVEVTLICLMGVIGSRMDAYSVIYAGWLVLMITSPRTRQARFWGVFTAFITFIIPFQYMLAVGFMPQFCIQYPWSGEGQVMRHVRSWFFLPYMAQPPHAAKLIFDYFLLLFASRQLQVFNIEKNQGSSYAGGCNKENIGADWETPFFVNPVPDFIGTVGNWLDVVKRTVFLTMLWVTLAIMFMAGTNRVNLFSMGYLIGSFVFFWQGSDFYLLPKPSILRWWSWLLIYNVAVVVLKTLLQVPGCIFGHVMQEHACWVVQLLGIGCVDKFAGGNIKHFLKMQYVKEASCPVPQEDIGLAWDGVCFAFLLLQRRLFHSYYFFRVIDESKATTVLASRGAELIEELRVKQMRIQEEQELKILEKIKAKMEKIKANQKRIQGFTKEPLHHDRGSEPGPDGKRRVYTKRHEAVRSGDYYMFDDIDDTEIQFKSDEEKEESDDELPKDMGLGKTQPSSVVHEGDVAISERAGPSDIDDYAPEPAEPETWFDKLKHILVTVWALVDSFLVSATRYVMRYSRDYRYVSNSLAIEKKRIKEKDSFGIGLRQGVQMRWEPLPDTLVLKDVTMLEEHDESVFKHEQPSIVHLVYATWYAVLAHTEIVCYIMVFINQIQSATILSIPLPLMVFLWGTLSIPRPTKTFWVTMIAYTEVIVLIKSMFQFEILPWNQKAVPANMPFTAPRIIGIERKAHYALYDLILLLLMFFHRFMLKSLGLWKESLPEVLLHDDFDYPVTKEDTQMLVEGRGSEVGRKYVVLHDMEGPREERVATAIRDEARGLSSQQSSSNDQDLGGDSGSKDGGGGSRDLDPESQVDEEADDEPVIAVRTTLENPYQNYMNVLYLALKRYIRPITNFFHHMTRPGARVTSDVYAYMFLCDFVNFLVVIFGFAAFGTHQGDGGVQAYLEENKVPIPFLIMLILQFALIIIDRALYLRKYMLGKILFQYGLIIGVHIWMFFVLPFITERNFNTLLAPPMWYMMKCIYLLLSAFQIRCGYPRRIIGNFLCKSYNFVNMVLFRGFMVVPFVFELRTLMDWIWTDTSMTLMDWLKMEDIFASVYLLKCSRNVEDEFPQARGVKKSNVAKYLLGGSVLTFVIAIIWFPLVFFAFGNTVGRPNPPTDVTVKIRIGPFLPVYQMSAQSHNIDVFTEQDYLQLNRLYARDRSALTFLSTYMFNDVAVISINPNSTMKWQISPPELERLEREAASNSSLTVKFTFVITHPSNAQNNPPVIEDSQEVSLDAFANDERNPEREVLYNMLVNQAKPTDWVNVKLLFPKFIKVFNKGTAKPAYQLMPESSGDPLSRLYRDVQLRLERQSNSMYWRVREKCTSGEILNSIPLNDCSMLVMYTFNDKLFPETLNFISGSGIIGLYTTFVFLAARVIRGFFSGIYTKIMFDDLPNVDRVLQLCLDIYLVREAIELTLEEDLFAKLVFLYRSPETMIKWTRPREDLEEQRALPPP